MSSIQPCHLLNGQDHSPSRRLIPVALLIPLRCSMPWWRRKLALCRGVAGSGDLSGLRGRYSKGRSPFAGSLFPFLSLRDRSAFDRQPSNPLLIVLFNVH